MTAEAQRELLVSKGMSETLLEDLRKGVSEFEACLETSRQGRRDHVGASHDLEAIGSAIVGQTRVLDGLVRYRFRGDAELMGSASATGKLIRARVSHSLTDSARSATQLEFPSCL